MAIAAVVVVAVVVVAVVVVVHDVPDNVIVAGIPAKLIK